MSRRDRESRSEVMRIPFESTCRPTAERLTREEFDAICNALNARTDGRFEKDGGPIRSRTYFRDRSSQNE